jgi:hypothetical protein
LKSHGEERLVQQTFNMLTAGVTCLKHEGFKEEREWRVIYAPVRWRSEFIDKTMKVINGIPQTIYRIPIDSNVSASLGPLDFSKLFDRLIIGPAVAYPYSMLEVFVEALKQAGVSDPLIKYSDIPIRSI